MSQILLHVYVHKVWNIAIPFISILSVTLFCTTTELNSCSKICIVQSLKIFTTFTDLIFTSGFPSLGTIDVLDWVIPCCRTCPLHYRMFSNILGWHPLTKCQQHHCPPTPLVITENVSRICQNPLGGKTATVEKHWHEFTIRLSTLVSLYYSRRLLLRLIIVLPIIELPKRPTNSSAGNINKRFVS